MLALDGLTAVAAEYGAPEGIALFIPNLSKLVWSAITFVLLFVVFWKYALPRLQTVLDERAEGIEKKLERAERDRAEAQELLEQYREQLAEARSEAAQIRADAQSDRATIVAEARTEATEAARDVTARAEARMTAEAAQVRAGLSRDVGRLATELAEKIIGETLDAERTSDTVDRFIAELEAAGAASEDDRVSR